MSRFSQLTKSELLCLLCSLNKFQDCSFYELELIGFQIECMNLRNEIEMESDSR